jgi:hypothetical protein
MMLDERSVDLEMMLDERSVDPGMMLTVPLEVEGTGYLRMILILPFQIRILIFEDLIKWLMLLGNQPKI